jgi:16S rRNA (uracil1498-N3)-methyltransferase
VRALDGRGQELTVRLTTVSPRAAEGLILAAARGGADPGLHLTLVQGIPRGDKMETVVRMATELGVSAIVPLVTARAVPHAAGSGWAGRLRRWQRVAKEAAKQSGRASIPDVSAPQTLPEWLGAAPAGLLVCLWEGERVGLAERLPDRPVDRAALIVGPEGGLTEAEVGRLHEAGALTAGLGPRILRAETAGPVGIALLQARYGDLGRTTH